MMACGRSDGGPPDLRPTCALDAGHDGVCDWHPAFGRAPGMVVRELIAELQRFDPDAPVTVGERPVRDVGRRERSGAVNPTLYFADGEHPEDDGLKALDGLRSTVRRHFTCTDPTADAWALKHWEVARRVLERYRTTLENIGFAREFPGDEAAALEGCRRAAREAIGR